MAMNEQQIWNLLIKTIKNPYGTAAIMGNLRAESSLNPLCMTGKNTKQWDSRQAYVDAVNNGTYDRYSFSHDGIAFGLVQWCYWSRKDALYEYAQNIGDIGSVEVQIGYLLAELPKYKTVWTGVCNADNVSTASDLVMEKYEKPGTMTEAAKQKRREFSLAYFEKYYHPEPEPEPGKKKYVKTTIEKVVVRSGNSTAYSPVTRITAAGTKYPWIATAENGWHAIQIINQVLWVSGDFTTIVEG